MKCPKCQAEFNLDAKTAKFCPECGMKFREVRETITMRPTTEEGKPIITIDTKVVPHEKPSDKKTPPEERWQGEHLEKEMSDPDAFSYIPEEAVIYEGNEGHVLSHRQIQTVKPIKIPSAAEQEPDFMPKGAVVEQNIEDEGNITIEKVEAGGEITVERIKLIDNPVENLIKPVRPKFSEIVDRTDIGIEQKIESLHIHGYSERAIKQWAKRVLEEHEENKE
jgi:hypothetical protein